MRTDWNNVADWYDQLVGDAGSEYHQKVVLPGVLRLLKPTAGAELLDLACGQGVLCRLLHESGAQVTGVDASRQLIKLARERGPESIRYVEADAAKLQHLGADRFAAVSCVLAIQNINPIGPVFEGVSRVLTSKGKFVLVMMHPAFRGPKETSWGWDEQQKVQYRRVDRYLIPRKTPIVTHPGSKPDAYTWSFHRPLEQYVRALSKADLLVDAIEEWPSHKKSSSGPRAAAENRAREEIPMFLAIRAIKVPRSLAP